MRLNSHGQQQPHLQDEENEKYGVIDFFLWFESIAFIRVLDVAVVVIRLQWWGVLGRRPWVWRLLWFVHMGLPYVAESRYQLWGRSGGDVRTTMQRAHSHRQWLY